MDVRARPVARRISGGQRNLVHAGCDVAVAGSPVFAGRNAILVSRLERRGPGVDALGVASGYAGAPVVTVPRRTCSTRPRPPAPSLPSAGLPRWRAGTPASFRGRSRLGLQP